MIGKRRLILGLVLVSLVGLGSVDRCWGQESIGECRIVMMDGKRVEGEVTELPDAYQVKTKYGVVVTIRKNEVRDITRLGDIPTGLPKTSEERAAAATDLVRREVTDAEIARILGDLKIDTEDVAEASGDVEAEVPLDEDSVGQMMRIAGRNAKQMETDHFALVYTSTTDKARRQASRLESIYRWNVRFGEMLGLPIQPLEYKLESYYFGDYEEFTAYSSTLGFTPDNALGFYYRVNNRTAFFDMNTWPEFKSVREAMEDADYERRRFVNNRIQRLSEYFNLEVIQHEAAHQIHFNLGVFPKRADVPTWLVEGMAQMFEVPPSKAGGSLGTHNDYRLFEFRAIYGGGQKLKKLPIDLRLFIVDDSQWKGAESYSMGWAFAYYLFRKHRDGFATYLRIMAEREDDVTVGQTDRQKEFEDAFGTKIDEALEKDFIEFTNSLQLRRSVMPL